MDWRTSTTGSTPLRTGRERRSFLRALGGVALAAGITGAAGCSALRQGSGLGGGSDHNVEDELVVRHRDDLDHEITHPEPVAETEYVVDPRKWSEYDGFVGGSIFVARGSALEAGDATYHEQRRTGTGVIRIDPEYPSRYWSPGIHLPSKHVPFAVGEGSLDRISNIEIFGFNKKNDIPDDPAPGEGIQREELYDGDLKDDWYQPYTEDDRLLLGAIGISQFIDGHDAYEVRMGHYLSVIGPTAEIGYSLTQLGRWPEETDTAANQ